jgi:hypothetical protein
MVRLLASRIPCPSSTRMRAVVRTRAVVVQPRAVRVSGAVRRHILAGVAPNVARAVMGVRV